MKDWINYMSDECEHKETATFSDGDPYTDQFGNTWQDYYVICLNCSQTISRGTVSV